MKNLLKVDLVIQINLSKIFLPIVSSFGKDSPPNFILLEDNGSYGLQ